MNQKIPPNLRSRAWLSLVTRMPAFAVALLWPAGTWRWWEAWLLIAIWVVFAIGITFYLLRHDPELLAERLRSNPIQKEQKPWDKVLMLLMLIAGIGLYITPGFDVMRYGWSKPLPVWIELLAMTVHIPALMTIAWTMHENTWLSQVVKIDQARGHQVITTGPYSIVRHPMYTAVIVLVFAVPIALGSRYGLIPAVCLTVIFVVRTALEDRSLQRELKGYCEYAQQTRFRLIPGLW